MNAAVHSQLYIPRHGRSSIRNLFLDLDHFASTKTTKANLWWILTDLYWLPLENANWTVGTGLLMLMALLPKFWQQFRYFGQAGEISYTDPFLLQDTLKMDWRLMGRTSVLVVMKWVELIVMVKILTATKTRQQFGYFGQAGKNPPTLTRFSSRTSTSRGGWSG